MIPLIKEGGLFREYACHVFEAYIAPVVAESWYPNDRLQFVRNAIHAVRNSPYSPAIIAINALTFNSLAP